MHRKVLFFIMVAALLATLAAPAAAQFREIRRVDLAQQFGQNQAYGVSVNHDAGVIYITMFPNTVFTYDEEFEEQLARVNTAGEQIDDMDYNPEDNSWWLVDRHGQYLVYHFTVEGEMIESFPSNGTPNGVCLCPENGHLYLACHPGGIIEMTVEGREIRRFQEGLSLTGIDYYPPNGTLLSMLGDDRIFEYTLEGQQVGNPFPNDVIQGNGQGMDYDPWRRLLYTPCQESIVQIWEDNYSAMPEPRIEPDGFEVVVPFGLRVEEVLTITNVGEEDSNLRFDLEDVGEGVDWLTCEPTQGILEFEESTEITLTIETADLEPDVFRRDVLIHCNNPEFQEVVVSVSLSVISGYGELRGTVTDTGTGAGVPGAVIIVERFGFQAVTNDEGMYRFEEIPAWIYNVHLLSADYLPQRVEGVEVIEDEVTVLDFNLLHSTCELSLDAINRSLAPDDEEEILVTMRNNGNGLLTWSMERIFPEVANIEPLTQRWHLPVAQVVNNDRIGAVEFVNDSFYVAAGVNGGDNLVYVLNREGGLVRQFPQFAESNYGIRGLAWDGELLWGFDANIWWGFTTNGELRRQFNSPFGVARAICWDTDDNQFWMSNITTNLYAVNAQGQVLRQLARPNGLHIYGLAWYPEDPDGCKLWMFCGDGDNRRQIWKVDVINNQTVFVFEPEIEGTAGSLTVSGLWDPWCWVLISATNANPDAIEIWQLGSRTQWLAVEPTEGVVEPGGNVELSVTLDAAGLPNDEEFTADLVFTHDGRGGQTVVPVVLRISEGPVHADRTLQLARGWNMVSVNLQPEPADDIRALMRPLVDGGNLLLMKDGAGHFYNPEFDFSNIDGWHVEQGYLLKTDHEGSLTLSGLTVMPNTPIQLIDGWQMIAYYPRVAVDAVTAFSGIVEQLILAKDGAGHFYNPEWGFSNMGDLVEGQGYQVKMDGDAELVYRVREGRLAENYELQITNYESRLLEHVNTGENMSLLVLAEGLDGAEVGVYAGEALVGSGMVSGGRCGVAVWGDDPTTAEVVGAAEGAALSLRLVGGRDRIDAVDVLKGGLVYKTDGFTVIRLNKTTVPMEFGIVSAYPNPFNSAVQLDYSLPDAGWVNLSIYDLNGRLVDLVVSSEKSIGVHSVHWDASSQPSGLYIARLESQGRTAMFKLAMLK